MAWYGEVKEFQQLDNSWHCLVEYFSDATPNVRIPRTFNWPLGIDLAVAQQEVILKGEEIKATASINTAAIIGLKISIP